jgi:tetratricopeptide (TPR) repeat protein
MFFKKKDKGEDASKDKGKKGKEEAAAPPPPPAAPPPQPAARAPEPPRAPAPAPSAPTPAAQPAPAAAAARPNGAAPPAAAPAARGGSPGATLDAVLTSRHGAGRGAPLTPDAVAAQRRGADMLAQSAEPVDRAAAEDLAAGRLDQAFNALRTAAEAAVPAAAPGRWRTLGQIAFLVDAGRAKWAYEHVFNYQPRQFWDCLYLARLRGIGRQMTGALEAAEAALLAAMTEEEKGIARAELGLIALATGDGLKGVTHAEAAIAHSRAVGIRNGEDERDLVGRQLLLGDSAMLASDLPKARQAFADSLAGARKLGQANPNDSLFARGVCELLEKSAQGAFKARDHGAAKGFLDEALGIRRKLQSVLTPAEGRRGLVQTLALAGEARLAAGDGAGAKGAFDEAIALTRQVSDANPTDPAAQRELWTVMWRIAQVEGASVGWKDVAQTMERMSSAGALDADAARFLDEAKRRALV